MATGELVIAVGRMRERARGVFFGWYIVSAASGIQALHTVLLMQSYGAYVVVLQDEFGWSKTALAAAFSLQRVESGLIGPIQGWMLQRWGPRNVMRVGTVIFGIGFMLFSQIDSLVMFYLTFLMMALGSSLAGFISLTSSIVNWFQRRRSTALGITQAGMSIGGMLVPIVAWSLIEFGWRPTAFVSGILVIVLGLPLVQVMRDEPEKYGLRPDGALPGGPADGMSVNSDGVTVPSEEPAEFTARQAMRTQAFWFISFGHALALLVVSAVMVHLVAHLTEGQGFSVTGAATVLAFMTGVTMVGQLVGGFLGDRFDKRIITTIAMFGHATALLALAWGGSLFWVLAFAVLHGLAWGMRGPLMQAMRADYFGRKSFAMVMGFSSMIVMWGMMSGPIIAGVMADYFGNYQWGFTVLAVLSACGSIFFYLARKPEPPGAARTGDDVRPVVTLASAPTN